MLGRHFTNINTFSSPKNPVQYYPIIILPFY